MEDGLTKEEIFEFTNIDPWFLSQFEGLHMVEEWLKTVSLGDLTADDFFEVKRKGFSDAQIARFTGGPLLPVGIMSLDVVQAVPDNALFLLSSWRR